jgi:multicomponent Na+:H+ antiporter subunit E
MLLINVLLALAWAALTGSFGIVDLGFGFAIGALALFFARRQFAGGDRYFRRITGTLWFTAYVVWELVLANVKVARTVLFTPTADLRPGIVAIPLDLKTDAEITTLANLITLTPGTLSLDVSDDRHVLYVHAIEVDDPARFRDETKRGFERAVREVFE